MKKHLFAFAFVASSLVFSCGQQDQVAPVSKPQKSSARIAGTCVQPPNNISVGYRYWDGVPVSPSVNTFNTDILPYGATTINVFYGNPTRQYFYVNAKVDPISGPGTYSEGWRVIHRVDETTDPIYETSAIRFISLAQIPATGTTYRLTLQYRSSLDTSADCWSVEGVYTVDFVR